MLQVFTVSKVADFYLWRVHFKQCLRSLASVKLLTVRGFLFRKITGFYSRFSNSSLWDVSKASVKHSPKSSPVYTAAARQGIKYFQRTKLQGIHTVKSFFLGSDTMHSFIKSICSRSRQGILYVDGWRASFKVNLFLF